MNLEELYSKLMAAHGPQGWWPLLSHGGTNPTKHGSIMGYHPGDYHFPRHNLDRFEIGAGSILTQNTAWTNVEKALRNLAAAGALEPSVVLALEDPVLATLIHSSGYHHAKTRTLKGWASFFIRLQGRTPRREELLALWGIGPETADSIRLYAYGELEMVVDAYTRRILSALDLISPKASYGDIKAFCVAGLPGEVPVYQEFHALMVEHAKGMRATRPARI